MIRSLSSIIILFLLQPAIAQDPLTGGFGFMRNMGQLHDQQGRAVDDVHYLWPGGKGLNVQVRNGAIAYDTYSRERSGGSYRMQRLDLRFLDATGSPVFIEEEARSQHFNFYLPHCREGILGVQHFDRIVQKDVIGGIDLVHSISVEGDYKYDLVVNDGADHSEIRIEYSGFDQVEVKADSLIFHFADRRIIETIPASWRSHDRSPIEMQYRSIENSPGRIVVGFTSADALIGKGIVIDPQPYLEWASYFGHEGNDFGTAVATDTIGIMYIAGHTDALITLATDSAHQSEFAGGTSDAFLMRMASWGSRIWCTYFGGSGNDLVTGVDVDHNYRVFLTGTTDSDSLATDSVFQLSPGGGRDVFIAKFDTAGTLFWSTYLGAANDDLSTGCVADGHGGVFITGNTADPQLFATSTVQPSIAHAGGSDAFVVNFDQDGKLKKCTFFGGAEDDEAFSIDRDHSGVIVIAGQTASAGIASPGAHQEQLIGTSDAFISLFNDSLDQLIWTTYFGADSAETATAITITDSTVFIGGFTTSPGLVTDTTAYQTTIGGGTDGFAARFSIAGDLQWSTYFGGMNDDRVNDIDLDDAGALYIMGTTASDSLVQDTTFQSVIAGGIDVFTAKFDTLDVLEWSSYFGGTQDDHGAAFAVYGVTVVFITGHTESTDLPIDDAFYPSLQYSSGGETDAFVTRFVQMESTPCVSVDCTGGGGGGGSAPWNGGGNGGSGEITCGVYGDAIGICLGESVTLSVVGGALGWGSYWMWFSNVCGHPAQFLAMGPELTITPTESMSVFVRAENAFTFTTCKEFEIIVDQPVTVMATGPENVCAGDPIELSVSGGICHYWSGPQDFEAFTAEAIAPSDSLSGIQHFVGWAISAHGACTDQDTVTVQINAAPVVEWEVHDPLCIDGTGSIAADSTSAANFTFEWLAIGSAGSLIEDLPPGEYTVIVTDTIGCTGTDTLAIVQPQPLVDSLIVVDASCGEDNGILSVVFNGNEEEFIFDWGVEGEEGPERDSLAAGDHSVSITDPLGCIFEFTATVIDTGSISVSINADTTVILAGGSVALNASIVPFDSATVIQWQPAASIDDPAAANVIASPDSSTIYSVLVISPFGCRDTDTISIEVILPDPIDTEDPQAVDPGCPDLFIPTIFSPNGDGVNDHLGVLGGCLDEMLLQIFDRWGDRVFATASRSEIWDGTIAGKPVPPGGYPFNFTATDEHGEAIEINGTITVVR